MQQSPTESSPSSGGGAEERDDEIRQNVRKALERPQYDVTQLYHETGVFQYIAKHPAFENLTLVVISLNAIWMAVDTDLNDAPVITAADPVFQIAENVFCMFFMFEWFCRFMAFKRKRDGLQDAWFVFDSMLVALMGLETWVMSIILLAAKSEGGSSILGDTSILRLFRLLRLSRMIRMLRSMPELMILVKGMMTAVKSVFFMMCLLVIIMYVFAIALTQLATGTIVGQDYFASVSDSMFTLLFYGTFLDSPTIMWDRLAAESSTCLFIYFFYSVLAALTILSMLIGVLCEVVSAVAANERDDLQAAFVTNQLQTIARDLDKDGNNEIDRDEFLKILENTRAVFALEQVGVDPVGIVDFADFIFDSEDTLSFEDFMNMVLELRGSNFATKKDIVDLKKFVVHAVQQFEANLARCARTGKERKTKIALRGVSGSRSYRHDLNVSEGDAADLKDVPTPTSGSSPDVTPTAASCLKDPPDLRLLPDPSPRSDTEWMRQELSELDRRTGGLEELLSAVMEEVKALVEELLRKEELGLPDLESLPTSIGKPLVGIGGSSSPKAEILPGLHAVQGAAALESDQPLLEWQGISKASSARAGPRSRLGADLFCEARGPGDVLRSALVSPPSSPKTRFACDFEAEEEAKEAEEGGRKVALAAATAVLAMPPPPPPPASPPKPVPEQPQPQARQCPPVLVQAPAQAQAAPLRAPAPQASREALEPQVQPASQPSSNSNIWLPPLEGGGTSAARAPGSAAAARPHQATANDPYSLPGSIVTPDRPPPIPASLLAASSRPLPSHLGVSAVRGDGALIPLALAPPRDGDLVGPFPALTALGSHPGTWQQASAAPVPPLPTDLASAATGDPRAAASHRPTRKQEEREEEEEEEEGDAFPLPVSGPSPGPRPGPGAARFVSLEEATKLPLPEGTTMGLGGLAKRSQSPHPKRPVPPALPPTLEKSGDEHCAEGRSDPMGPPTSSTMTSSTGTEHATATRSRRESGGTGFGFANLDAGLRSTPQMRFAAQSSSPQALDPPWPNLRHTHGQINQPEASGPLHPVPTPDFAEHRTRAQSAQGRLLGSREPG